VPALLDDVSDERSEVDDESDVDESELIADVDPVEV
jgi:hypothetical protein